MRLAFLAVMLSGCSVSVAPAIRQTFRAPELVEGTVLQYVSEFCSRCPCGKAEAVIIASQLPTTASPTAAGTCTLNLPTAKAGGF